MNGLKKEADGKIPSGFRAQISPALKWNTTVRPPHESRGGFIHIGGGELPKGIVIYVSEFSPLPQEFLFVTTSFLD